MRILVLSDIHANLTALEAVLASAGAIDATWCLGDIVGYGPDPNECVTRVRKLTRLSCVMGNHDIAVVNEKNIEKFNEEAALAIRYTRQVLSEENLSFLKKLREKVVTQTMTLTHGSPRNPVWEYLVEPFVAMQNFAYFNTQLAFVGHSHLPVSYTMMSDGERIMRTIHEGSEELEITGRAILNPGSVGQPRDFDPRASYGIYDPEKNLWQLCRVEYDIPSVQQRIRAAGLPEKGASRLAEGR